MIDPFRDDHERQARINQVYQGYNHQFRNINKWNRKPAAWEVAFLSFVGFAFCLSMYFHDKSPNPPTWAGPVLWITSGVLLAYTLLLHYEAHQLNRAKFSRKYESSTLESRDHFDDLKQRVALGKPFGIALRSFRNELPEDIDISPDSGISMEIDVDSRWQRLILNLLGAAATLTYCFMNPSDPIHLSLFRTVVADPMNWKEELAYIFDCASWIVIFYESMTNGLKAEIQVLEGDVALGEKCIVVFAPSVKETDYGLKKAVVDVQMGFSCEGRKRNPRKGSAPHVCDNPAGVFDMAGGSGKGGYVIDCGPRGMHPKHLDTSRGAIRCTGVGNRWPLRSSRKVPGAEMTRIGITGHQRLTGVDAWTWVAGVVDVELGGVAPPLVGITSLAIGTDQLIARLVLKRGGTLHVVLPFADIERSFAPADVSAYRELVVQSTVEVLDAPGTDEDAYLAAGMRVVELSDILLAVWDGKPAQGKGGTADVVSYAISRGVPLIHVDPILRTIQHNRMKGRWSR
jgi:hypothetical protein